MNKKKDYSLTFDPDMLISKHVAKEIFKEHDKAPTRRTLWKP
jgi:hypothetical protein